MLVHNFPITRVNFLFFSKLICHKMSTTGFFSLGMMIPSQLAICKTWNSLIICPILFLCRGMKSTVK